MMKCYQINTLSEIVFQYPYDNPTDTLTLTSPNLGNEIGLNESLSVVRLKSGQVVVFKDPIWPSFYKHTYTFALRCTDPSVQSILDFLKISLGHYIKVKDYEGRIWKHIITNPNTPIAQSHIDLVTFQLDFEGELKEW